ncbi:Microbial collagenase [bacterium HR11]|nr:Microbial collagenase [bacterium HR11]
MTRPDHFSCSGFVFGRWLGGGLLLLMAVACGQVDFTAPTGSVLQIFVKPEWVPANGGTATVTVLGFRSTGAPLPDGTLITFTTTLGRIDPPSAKTKDGRVEVLFISDERSGVAKIQAFSGPEAKAEAEITVGTAVVANLELRATPSYVPAGGGTVRLIARATAQDGNPVPNVPIVFQASAGTLASGGQPVLTNANGEAEDSLFTRQKTEVKASIGTKTATLTLPYACEQRPTPRLNFSPQTPVAGQPVFFNANGSFDPTGPIVRYEWNFGDGGSGFGPEVVHVYSTVGVFNVTLTVTNDRGCDNSTNSFLNVSSGPNQPPQAVFTVDDRLPGGNGDGILRVGETLTFDASASFDPDGTIVAYTWDFGDTGAGFGKVTTHAYTAAGNYTVRLTVRDNLGAIATAERLITVQP